MDDIDKITIKSFCYKEHKRKPVTEDKMVYKSVMFVAYLYINHIGRKLLLNAYIC